LIFGMNTRGWGRRYRYKAVVPHFGAPTMKKFGVTATVSHSLAGGSAGRTAGSLQEGDHGAVPRR
jgi:hypothetical protein